MISVIMKDLSWCTFFKKLLGSFMVVSVEPFIDLFIHLQGISFPSCHPPLNLLAKFCKPIAYNWDVMILQYFYIT